MGQSHQTPSSDGSAEKSETQSRATDESGQDRSGGNAAAQEAVATEKPASEGTSTLDSAEKEVSQHASTSTATGPVAAASAVQAITGGGGPPSGRGSAEASTEEQAESSGTLDEAAAELDETTTLQGPASQEQDAEEGESESKEPALPAQYADGLRSEASISDYAGAMAGLAAQWDTPAFTADKRAAALEGLVNDVFDKFGIERPNIQFVNTGAASGSFKGLNWRMEISEAVLTNGGADLPELANTLYHESRHAEQMHRVVQHMAQQGFDAATIAKTTGYNGKAIKTAMSGVTLEGESGEEVAGWIEAHYGDGPEATMVKAANKGAKRYLQISNHLAHVQKIIAQAEGRNVGVISQWQTRREEWAAWRDQLSAKSGQIAASEAEVTSWQQQYNATNSQISSSKAKLASLNSGLKGFVGGLSSLFGVQSDVIKEGEAIQAKLVELQRQLVEAEAKLQEVTARYQAIATERPTEAQIQEANQRTTEADNAVTQLLAEQSFSEAEHENWAANLTAAQAQEADYNTRWEADIQPLYAAYRAMPFEADAFAVGDAAEVAVSDAIQASTGTTS